MFKFLHKTDECMAGLIARIALGIVILPHGLQKLLGLFGGSDFIKTVEFFTSTGMPLSIAVLVIIGESLGAVSLIIGFLARFSAAAINIIMLGAIFMVHLSNGFFMNWFGNQNGEGFEYHILAIGLGLVVMFTGAGKFSIDNLISRKIYTPSFIA